LCISDAVISSSILESQRRQRFFFREPADHTDDVRGGGDNEWPRPTAGDLTTACGFFLSACCRGMKDCKRCHRLRLRGYQERARCKQCRAERVRTMIVRPSQKHAVACQRCRGRHLRCDRTLPHCGRCLKDGVLCVPSGCKGSLPTLVPVLSPEEEVVALAHDLVQLLTELGIDWAREWGS
jgi:hypothetical protein